MGKKHVKSQGTDSPSARTNTTIDGEALLAVIADATRVIESKRGVIDRGVREARAAGVTWPQIGRALGVTTQAAQQRYGGTAKMTVNSDSTESSAEA